MPTQSTYSSPCTAHIVVSHGTALKTQPVNVAATAQAAAHNCGPAPQLFSAYIAVMQRYQELVTYEVHGMFTHAVCQCQYSEKEDACNLHLHVDTGYVQTE